MKEIHLSKGRVTLVDDDDYAFLMQWKWHFGRGYATRTEVTSHGRRTVVLHSELLGGKADHKDGNRLNNTRPNLRICTDQQNNFNRRVAYNSKTGFKGVSYNKLKKKYNAKLVFCGKKIWGGTHKTPEEAAKAYDDLARTYFGDFAALNFPRKGERGCR